MRTTIDEVAFHFDGGLLDSINTCWCGRVASELMSKILCIDTRNDPNSGFRIDVDVSLTRWSVDDGSRAANILSSGAHDGMVAQSWLEKVASS